MRPWLLVLLLVSLSCGAQAQPVDTIPAENDDVSLRDYTSARIDALQKIMDERDERYAQRFEAQQENVASALQAAEKAVTKAEEAANKRFDSVNEFRATLTDQAATFMSKAEADARLKANEDKITALTARLDDERSRGEGASNLWAVIAVGVGLVVAIAGFALSFRRPAPTKA